MRRSRWLLLGALSTAGIAGPSLAAPAAPGGAATASATASEPASTSPTDFYAAPSPARLRLFTQPVSTMALAQQRGGSDSASHASLQGSVSDTSAVNVATGGNVISGSALSGASGVPVVIQNSGNNVLIQSATIVNVTLK